MNDIEILSYADSKITELEKENEELKEQNKTVLEDNGTLNKRVDELRTQIEKMKENCLDIMRVQESNLTDDYMAGMYNGMVVIYNSCFRDTVNELEKSYCSKNEKGKWELAE